MNYTGRIIQIIDGRDVGAEYLIVSEPMNVNKSGDAGVKVRCVSPPIFESGLTVGDECLMSFEDIFNSGIIR